MIYFTKKNFLVPLTMCKEEFQKINKFMELLENSKVWKLLRCKKIINLKLLDIEDKCIFDIRVNYITEENISKHTVIEDFINNYIIQYKIFKSLNTSLT